MPRGVRTATEHSALRLLVFNTQHAAPQRARRQAAWLAGREDADVVVLTEVGHGPGGDALAQALAEHGYRHCHALVPQVRDYRTVLASRTAALEPVECGVDFLPHRAPAVLAHVNGGIPVALCGLYVPSRGPAGRRNQAKRAFQDAVTAALPGMLARFRDMPVVTAGDLNVIEPGHIPAHQVFGPWEYAFYEAFGAVGLADAFRLRHPRDPGHSWYGRSGRGYRFDYAFTTAPHRVTACDYIYEPREDDLSDHAALTLRLDLADPSTTERNPQ